MPTSTSPARRWIVLLFTGALLLVPHAIQAQATRTVSETVNLDRDGHVRLSAFTGAIDITTWDRADVQIDVRIEGDEEDVDATRIRIDGNDRELRIETDYDAVERRLLGFINMGSGDRPATYYTIRMPATAALSIEDFSSEIDVTGLRADLAIETFSSPVTLRDIEGSVHAETYSSDLEAHDLAGDLHVETFSGDATVALRRLDGNCQFESFSGDLALYLPADAGFDLDAEFGMNGDLQADFALASVRADGNEYRGAVQGGGPRIRFETFSGDLALRTQ